jgi:hypothetical protein
MLGEEKWASEPLHVQNEIFKTIKKNLQLGYLRASFLSG